MAELVIGASVMAVFMLVVIYAIQNKLKVSWWQWLLTIMCMGFVVFTLLVVTEFLHEGTPQGALINGMILGIVAIVWAILLARFVFKSEKEVPGEKAAS